MVQCTLRIRVTPAPITTKIVLTRELEQPTQFNIAPADLNCTNHPMNLYLGRPPCTPCSHSLNQVVVLATVCQAHRPGLYRSLPPHRLRSLCLHRHHRFIPIKHLQFRRLLPRCMDALPCHHPVLPLRRHLQCMHLLQALLRALNPSGRQLQLPPMPRILQRTLLLPPHLHHSLLSLNNSRALQTHCRRQRHIIQYLTHNPRTHTVHTQHLPAYLAIPHINIHSHRHHPQQQAQVRVRATTRRFSKFRPLRSSNINKTHHGLHHLRLLLVLLLRRLWDIISRSHMHYRRLHP